MIKLAHNLEDLAEGIGNYMGMADGIEQPEYMDILMKKAFAVADRHFNQVSAAAAASGTPNIAHMYEFGTKGVHDGGTLSPTAQSSRLWKTVMAGGGGRKVISFVFRPAVKPRTQIYEDELGNISAAYKPKALAVHNDKRYKWPTKASDTENGRALSIRVRDARVLFIPVHQGLQDATEAEKAKGFGFRKQHINVPGEWSGDEKAGQFNIHFYNFWRGAGADNFNQSMIKEFNHDVRAFNKYLKVSPSPLKLVGNINGKAAAARGKTHKQWTLKARSNASERLMGDVVS